MVRHLLIYLITCPLKVKTNLTCSRNCFRTSHVCVYESAKPPLRERASLRRPGEQSPWSIDKELSSVAMAAVESPASSITSLSIKTLSSLHNFAIEMPLESKNLLNYCTQQTQPNLTPYCQRASDFLKSSLFRVQYHQTPQVLGTLYNNTFTSVASTRLT